MVTSDNTSFTRIADTNKAELKEAAEYFGVALEEGDNVDVIRAKFREDGIDDSQWARRDADLEAREKAIQEALEAAEAQKEAAVESDKIEAEKPEEVETLLIKMVRKNPTMNIRGYKFTQKHPYQVVPVRDAEFIVAHYKGFTVATPSEVESYYE